MLADITGGGEVTTIIDLQSVRIILPIERLSLVFFIPEDEVDGLVIMWRTEVTGQTQGMAHHTSHIHRVQS